MKKQMGYADGKQIPYVAIIGGDELASGRVMLKNMITGEQGLVNQEELIEKIKN
jgi:histidyl-tRNA synthetase